MNLQVGDSWYATPFALLKCYLNPKIRGNRKVTTIVQMI